MSEENWLSLEHSLDGFLRTKASLASLNEEVTQANEQAAQGHLQRVRAGKEAEALKLISFFIKETGPDQAAIDRMATNEFMDKLINFMGQSKVR